MVKLGTRSEICNFFFVRNSGFDSYQNMLLIWLEFQKSVLAKFLHKFFYISIIEIISISIKNLWKSFKNSASSWFSIHSRQTFSSIKSIKIEPIIIQFSSKKMQTEKFQIPSNWNLNLASANPTKKDIQNENSFYSQLYSIVN